MNGIARRLPGSFPAWPAPAFRPAGLLALLVFLVAACARQATEGPRKEETRVEDLSKPPVEITVRTDPARVDLRKNTLLSITVTCPKGIEVDLPPLDDRVTGFRVNDTYSSDVPAPDGKISFRKTLSLTPLIAEEYRLGPIAVACRDARKGAPEQNWFPTRAIVFDTVFKNVKAGKDITDVFRPVWIMPSWKTLSLYALALAAVIALVLVIWKLGRRIRRQIRLMRMSPRERALEELAELMAKKLVEKNQVKEFYLELTMIVRRFIERLYRIRAPEQTTEEFLLTASRDPRFAPGVVRKLKSFLEAADLVKFAAYRPMPQAIDKAIGTAKDYIEVDAGPDTPTAKEGR